MYGNIPPFSSFGGGYGITGSPSTGWTFTRTAQAGVSETIATFKVTDNAAAKLEIVNSSSTDATFIPMILSTGSTTRQALIIRCDATTDSGSNPVMAFNSRTAGGAAITTRTLVEVQNNSNAVLSLLPLNSGANSALSWGTQTGGAPTFTTRSAGVRMVLHDPGISGTVTDFAIGAQPAGNLMWLGIPQANSSYAIRVYGGETTVSTIRGDGLFDTTGTIRATGTAAPANGTGAELRYNGTNATFQGYDRTGSAYVATTVDGLSVALRPSGAATFTAAPTVNTHAVPVQMRSYTVATLPATPAAGLVAYCSDAAVAPCICFGNGTVWKRCDNASTTVI